MTDDRPERPETSAAPPQNTFDQRLAALKARNKGWDGGDPAARSRAEGLGAGMRIAVEFTAAIGVGVAMGLFLDRWLGTMPLMLILFLVIGLAAGVLNVIRTSEELDRRARARREEADGSNS